MSESYRRNKRGKIGKIIYTVLLVIFALTLITISYIVLSDWQNYLVAYENSQPDTVIADYMNNLKSTRWEELVEQSVSRMEHPFQTDEECEAVINQMLGETLQYKEAPSNSENVKIYNVYCNGNPVGQFQMERDLSYRDNIKIDSVLFLRNIEFFWFIKDADSLCPWKVTGDNYDISGFTFTSSTSAVVPETYSIRLNGVEVGKEYITETGIKYDVLEPYYENYPGLPTKVKYEVGNIFGKLEPVVYDAHGNEFKVDPYGDDSQFMEPCSPEEVSALSDFAFAFLEPYARFTGTKNVWANYGDLKNYVKEGSEFAKRMDLFIEGADAWLNFHSVTVSNASVNSVYSLGGGFYVINITYDTTNYAEYKTVEETNTRKLIVCWDNSGIKAVSVE